ncbi:contractile injection system tape measure protein [Mangrovibacter phragmitis]|uniref:contractile injection system tape measure protein n=1 Tax=Mangrovibacter phragmitis TaxID=1691903 RepID=UPI00336A73DD
MNQLHKINQASIEFDFTEFSDAETFELRAAQWVTQQLLPVIETIFDDVCPEHQTLVIDTLTLDLGEFNSTTFYTQAPEKLKYLLQEKLRAQLRTATQNSSSLWTTSAKTGDNQAHPEPNTMVVLSQQQLRWSELWQFLNTGILPWTSRGEQSLESLGLVNELTGHIAQFIHALNNARQPEQILRRVVLQFPASCIEALFASLTTAYQWEIMTFLLTHPKSLTGELHTRLAQAWYSQFIQLLAQHNLMPLRPYWAKIMRQFAPQLINALWQRHTDNQLPGNLVRDLNETERLLLLSVLTPQEYPFLAAILQSPDLWKKTSQPGNRRPAHPLAQVTNAGEPNTALPPSQVHQQVWLFTLHYLLVDRGSAFNRQSYMSGLIIHMANAQNQSADTLLASLISAISNTTTDSTLQGQLLDLLLTIQPTMTSHAGSKPPEPAETILPISAIQETDSDNTNQPINADQLHHINELVVALCSGTENQLLQFWPGNSQTFAALLRWCGQLDNVRRHWSETYPDKTLLALVDVLEPLATLAVRILVVEKRLLAVSQPATTSERAADVRLWRYTFAFLIVEKSGAFNQKSYLQYVIQRMAARLNVSYTSLLAAMLENIATAGGFFLPGTTIRNVLEELVVATHPQTTTDNSGEHSSLLYSLPQPDSLTVTQLADIEDIIATLQRGEQPLLGSHINPWRHDYGQHLPQIIRQQGCNPSLLKHWVTHFADSALFTITAILNPHATETVRRLIDERQTIDTAIQHASGQAGSTHARNALWELTLHYLISRRGSEFNQYQFLLSITELLSARYQINAEVLINEWLKLSGRGFLWRQQLTALATYHKHPPVAAPQLLGEIQSATQTVLSEQQRTLLQHYATINATRLATQLQTWNTAQLARMVNLMQPQLSERVIVLLPLLLSIVHEFKLAPHWFYQRLLSADCPTTPEQWLQRLLHQINKYTASQDLAHYHQLVQCVLSSNDIHQDLAERHRWLYSIAPEEDIRDKLQQWLDSKAPVPEQALRACLASSAAYKQPLIHWLKRMLTNPPVLQRWLDALSPETHQALLLPTVTSATLSLLALRHAFCQLFESPKQGERLFWQTLYRQLWFKGVTLSGSALINHLLIELNQLWVTHPEQGKALPSAKVAGLIERLLPSVSSASLRNTLTQIARQTEPRTPEIPLSVAQLNHQQPEIKQLVDALEIPGKTVKKSPAFLREKPRDDAQACKEPVTIHNAGLVIASTWIPVLFQRIALTDGNKFVDIQAQYQGLFCLQWMTNHTNNAPEYQLLLNKVLCGIAPSWPVPQQVPLPDGAETVIDGLLTAIIAHWKVLGNTSISGLQSTFIQREGLLTFTPKHWQLNIIPGTFDMLLDHLPWRYQTIKYPWMDKPLFVSWR